jgi:diguanylate cyclase (GGDEF)-like protein
LEWQRLERIRLERQRLEWQRLVYQVVSERSSRSPRTGWILCYAAILGAITAGLVTILDDRIHTQIQGGLPVFLGVLVGTLIATAFPVYVELGRETHSFMLYEVPAAVGLLTLGSRQALLAAAIGAAIARVFVHRNTPIKLAVNIFVTAIEVAVFARIAQLIAPGLPVTSTRTWIAVLVGLAFANAVSSLAVSIAIRISGANVGLVVALRNMLVGMLGAIAMGMVAIVGLMLTVVNSASVAFTVVMVAGLIVAYRQQVVVRARYDAMVRLERFTRALAPDRAVDSILDKLLHHAAELMNTEEAAITLTTSTGQVLLSRGVSLENATDEVACPSPGDWVWVRSLSQKQAFLLSKSTHANESDVVAYLAGRDARDLVVAPLHLDADTVGVLVGRNRRNAVVRMSAADLDLVTTMAHHASVTLERSRLIEKLELEVSVREYEATHDSLTGLHNRAYFNVTADAHIASSLGAEQMTALMIIDLNHFKKINDTMGHHAGDEVLVQIAGRLINALPKGSQVARLGGDEFAVLVPDVKNFSGATDAATALREAIKLPVRIDEVQFGLDASIGVSIFPEHGVDRNTLMKRADIAMYAAKDRKGGVPIAVFDPSQQRWTAREVALIEDLRKAIENDQLSIAFQPKTNLQDGRVIGVEALCRWNHPIQGAIRPDEFIGLAEQAGLIDQITDFMLRGSLRQCRSWLDDGFEVGIAVNIPAQSLVDPTLPSRIAALANACRVEPNLLTLEVTEGGLMEDARTSRAVMTELRSLGFRVSIDDFGTGYSSLAYLHTLPVDELKIDRAFVQRIGKDETSEQIVHVIVELAKTFGLRTVAEGIETDEIHDALRELGVELGQGYLMGRPAQAHELTELLRHGYRPAVTSRRSLVAVS